MNDPREIALTCHSNSTSPRARRWYGLAMVCRTPAGIYELHRIPAEMPASRSECVRVAKAVAGDLELPLIPGLFKSHFGKPVERIA